MRILLLVFGISLLSISGFSQSQSVISVRDALQIALQNNPDLQRAEEQIRVQKSLLGPSWGLDNPELYYFKEGMEEDLFSEQRWGVSQKVVFPVSGYLRNRKAAADLRAAELQAEYSRSELRAMVKSAYTELAYSLKNVELVQQELELANDLQEIARARLEVGESTELDLIQAEIRLTRAQNNLKKAEELKNGARYELFRIIGLVPGDQQYGITYPDTLAWVDPVMSQESILQRVDFAAEMNLVRSYTEAADKNISVAKSSYLPDLRVNVYRQDFGAGYDFYGFEIGVSIPLWFGWNQGSQVQRANAQFSQAKWSEKEALLRVRENAEKAWHGYETSREAILSYRNFVQSRAATLLELTQEGYRMGELDLLRVLESQRTYLEAEQQYYQSLKNYYLQLIELEKYLPNEIVFTE
jgi:outer membrane protein, heavy metal efflux system